MTLPTDLRVVELVAARLCHDLIGPVAAISNGVELMDDDDPDFVRDAVALVGDSARKAASRLQFYRFAYAYSQGASAGPPPHVLARDLFDGSAVLCDYGDGARSLGLEWQKLACNLLLVGSDALPRGGRLVVTAAPPGIELEGIGEGSGPAPEIRAALALDLPIAEVTARNVGAYFAGLLGNALGYRIVATSAPGSFRFGLAPLER